MQIWKIFKNKKSEVTFRNEEDATATARSRATAMTNVRQFIFSFNKILFCLNFTVFAQDEFQVFFFKCLGKKIVKLFQPTYWRR